MKPKSEFKQKQYLVFEIALFGCGDIYGTGIHSVSDQEAKFAMNTPPRWRTRASSTVHSWGGLLTIQSIILEQPNKRLFGEIIEILFVLPPPPTFLKPRYIKVPPTPTLRCWVPVNIGESSAFFARDKTLCKLQVGAYLRHSQLRPGSIIG